MICIYQTDKIKMVELEVNFPGCRLATEKGQAHATTKCPYKCYYHWGEYPNDLHLCKYELI